MSDENKGFDRAIEQMMNEHSVSPPFGMWNRISAELDAQPMPLVSRVPMPSSANTLTGYFAATFFIGVSLLSAYFYHPKDSSDATSNTPQYKRASVPIQHPQPENQLISPVTEEGENTIAVRKTDKSEILIVSREQPVKKEIVPITTISLPKQIAFSERTLTLETATTETEEYYFPPVDINVDEFKGDIAQESDSKDKAEESKNSEKKIRATTGGGDKKIKFKKKKSRGFTYGRLNRLKK